MRPSPLWKVSVATLPQAEEAVSELLGTIFGQPATSYTNLESGETAVTVYLAGAPERARGRSGDGKVLCLVRSGLERIKRHGLETGPARISVMRVRRQDWAESWKRHFKPIAIGRALLLRPSWSRQRPRKGQAEVILDPGLSFGTGQHPTTAFCLRQLVAQRPTGDICRSLLDIGTGSGILAIAAAKLDYAPVEAFDLDPEAVRVARANACKNRVEGRIRILRRDITRMPPRGTQKYSLVCANLLGSLLLNERDSIAERVQPGGMLVLAGILESEFTAVRRAYEAAGMRLAASRAEKEWRSGAFRAQSL